MLVDLDGMKVWLVSKIKDSLDPDDWKELDFFKNCTFKNRAKTAMFRCTDLWQSLSRCPLRVVWQRVRLFLCQQSYNVCVTEFQRSMIDRSAKCFQHITAIDQAHATRTRIIVFLSHLSLSHNSLSLSRKTFSVQ